MKKIIQFFLGAIKSRINGIHKGKKCYIGINCKIYNKGEIRFGDNVRVRPGTGLYSNKNSVLILENNVEIGRDSTIASHNKVILGDGVLTGPHVFIADYNHEYENISIPIYKQGERRKAGDAVIIGAGTWLGTNVVVVGNVRIGKNCVIGANSVVTKDIPDYCVAVGVPAKIVKRFDCEKHVWVRM